MFQYATGRALSLRQQKDSGKEVLLKLDATNYSKRNGVDTDRHYGLNNFNIIENIATDDEISKLKYPKGVASVYYKKIRTKLGLFNISFVPRMLKRKGDIYLDGFWQSEKYFDDFADQIHIDYTSKNPLGDHAKIYANEIESKEITVSLHVRRGDYANDPNTNKYWGTFSNEYYSVALKHIASKVGNRIHVFVFSDDIEWVKEHISIPYPTTYISSPDIVEYEEIVLMSMCHHNIIANSTFSWWGAWLNRNPEKIVIAPKNWVKRRKLTFRNIVPKSWIRI
jgi:hypothetical protein